MDQNTFLEPTVKRWFSLHLVSLSRTKAAEITFKSRHHRTRLACLILAFAIVISTEATSAEAVRVVDGDTLKVGDVTYRLNGIDAPEAGQTCLTSRGRPWACGEVATDQLKEFLNKGSLWCLAITEDAYGRTVATCFIGDADIGREMVRTGAAWAFVKYSLAYVADEAYARNLKVGIWAGSAKPAWEYRADRWRVAKQNAPDGCPIKGNISSNGRIYHTPWSRWYNRTKISPERGERWFCNEAEAIAAGWRAPDLH